MPQLRPATPLDIPEMQALFIDAITNRCAGEYTHEQREAWMEAGKNPRRWEIKIEKSHFLLAIEDDNIAGFASLVDNHYIDMFYVGSTWGCRGIGNVLYEAVEKMARSFSVSQLVSDVSITARRFFEKQGFAAIRTNTVLLNGVELTNYRMTKQLNP